MKYYVRYPYLPFNKDTFYVFRILHYGNAYNQVRILYSNSTYYIPNRNFRMPKESCEEADEIEDWELTLLLLNGDSIL